MTGAAAGLAGVFVLGVSVGLTACAVTCLPFIGTWALARGGGGWAAAEDLAAFLTGRLAAYAALGAAAGQMGEALSRLLAGPAGHWAIGSAGVAAGLALLAGRGHRSGCGALAAGLPPVALGAALSLTPCVPLASLLAAAALAGGLGQGAAMGLVFGLGAAVTPLLLAVPLLGLFGNALRGQGLQRLLRWGGAVVLAGLGLRRILLAV